MKKNVLILLLFCFAVPALAKKGHSPKDFAKKLARKVEKQLEYNKAQYSFSDKVHIVDFAEFESGNYMPDPNLHEHYQNNGAYFWNLSAQDKQDIQTHINNYSSVFNDVEYIIVIGSIFKSGDMASSVEDQDWESLQKQKKIATATDALSDDDAKFFSSVKQELMNNISIQYPQKYVVNWFINVFTEGADNSFKVRTLTFITNKSGVPNTQFTFAGLNGQFGSGANSKKDWIKKNIDFDANTIKYTKDFETNGYLVNKSSRTIQTDDFLKDLLDGKKSYTAGNTVYRKLKLIILIMDETTSQQDRDIMTALTSKTHVVVLLDYKNSKPDVVTRFPDKNVETVFQGFINELFVEGTKTFWQRFGDELGNYGNGFAVCLYDVLDWMANGIGKAKVPENVWNCCVSDYNPQYARIFGFVLQPVINILNGVSGSTIGSFSTDNCPVADLPKAQFAMYVGVWNGLVDVVQSIPTMLKLVISSGISAKDQVNPATGQPFRNDWGLMEEEVKKNGGGLIGFFKVIGKSLKDMHDPTRPCLLAHSIGSDVLNIVAAFFTAGESLAAGSVGSLTRTFFVTMEKLDIVSGVLSKVGGIAGKYVLKPIFTPVVNGVKQSVKIVWKEVSNFSGEVFELVIENGKTTLRVLDAAAGVLKDFNWEFVQPVIASMRTADGRLVDIRLGLPKVTVNPGSFADDLMRLKDKLTVEIRDVLKDKDGIPLVNEKGEGLAVIKKEAGGAEDEVVAVVVSTAGRFIAKSGAELKTFLDELVTQPAGKPYSGKFYKSVSKNAELTHNAKPDIISEYSIEEAWGRYDLQGESGMYYSKTLPGNQTEMSVYGDWSSYSTYEFNNVQINNMLDLTDPSIVEQLGSEFNKLVLTTGTKPEMYEFTNVIGTWARSKGYKGLIVPGARGTQDYTNIVVFSQSDLATALNGITPTKLK